VPSGAVLIRIVVDDEATGRDEVPTLEMEEVPGD